MEGASQRLGEGMERYLPRVASYLRMGSLPKAHVAARPWVFMVVVVV